MSLVLPFRQIHLDFHTGPDIPDVGSQFDADEFGRQLAEARVNSVTLFAKCHHGHLYYNTDHPARHPGLKKNLDLLGEQIEACRKRGIRTPIYLSVQCDEYVANTYPQWLARTKEGGPVGAGPLGAGWHIIDMASPYQDYLADQIAEVMKKFKPVDGIFLDMCWDQPSCSPWAIDGMLKNGLDPEKEQDRNAFAALVVRQYMERYNKLVDDLAGRREVPIFYNSRPKTKLPAEKKFLKHIEIEALPTGGWGYTYFPLNVRFARTFGLPYLGMTGRFHKSWADFGGLKPRAALMYECSQMLAHGARCSVGDQLHPRGTFDPAAYQLIGSVYRHVEQCEPWCEGAKPVTEIAVLRAVDGPYHTPPGDAKEGVVRALQQLGHQFDFLPLIPEVKLDPYELVIVTSDVVLDATMVAKLKKHLKAGKALLIEAPAGFDAAGKPLIAQLGAQSKDVSPFATTYLRFEARPEPSSSATDHVMYERGLRLKPARGATVLARVVEPYFDRSWKHFSSHFQTPANKVSPWAAAVASGRTVTMAYPMFKAYAMHGNLPYRRLIDQAIQYLLPKPLTRVNAPSHVEVTLTRQARRMIAHVLSFSPQRRTPNLDIVEEPTPLISAAIGVRLSKPPKRVSLQPVNIELTPQYRDGYAWATFSSARGHDMIVFE